MSPSAIYSYYVRCTLKISFRIFNVRCNPKLISQGCSREQPTIGKVVLVMNFSKQALSYRLSVSLHTARERGVHVCVSRCSREAVWVSNTWHLLLLSVLTAAV